MMMLNGLSPDDTSMCSKDIIAPRITKEYWPIPVSSCPKGFKVFNFQMSLEVLSRFYEERDTLVDVQISLALLHKSVNGNSMVIADELQKRKKCRPTKSKTPWR